MDIPFWNFTEEQKTEATGYIQEFIDNCLEHDGTVITPIAAFPINDEIFTINYSSPKSEYVQFKKLWWGEVGKQKYNDRMDREYQEEIDARDSFDRHGY